MIRERLVKAHPDRDGAFRWRGDGVSRIEGLSDAVFGFAITLLVVSLDVPNSFGELRDLMRGFLPFAASFAVLVIIWHAQYKFFRRYGLEDTRTIVLTVVLLFVVLFYIYPLKFLFGTLIPMLYAGVAVPLGAPRAFVGPPAGQLTSAEWPSMMAIYGAGWVALYTVFALLYGHAYRKRAEIGLDELETLETRHSVIEQLVMIGLGLVSLGVALGAPALGIPPGAVGFLSGIVYMFIGPAQFIHWGLFARRRKRLVVEARARRAADAAAADVAPAGAA